MPGSVPVLAVPGRSRLGLKYLALVPVVDCKGGPARTILGTGASTMGSSAGEVGEHMLAEVPSMVPGSMPSGLALTLKSEEAAAGSVGTGEVGAAAVAGPVTPSMGKPPLGGVRSAVVATASGTCESAGAATGVVAVAALNDGMGTVEDGAAITAGRLRSRSS